MVEATPQKSSVMKLRHLPSEFVEEELHGYFKQFGDIKRVRVKRSKRAHPTGIAYVEFDSPEVAEIAADTMDNYILGEKRIRCTILTRDRLPLTFRRQLGGLFAPHVRPGEKRHAYAKRANAERPEKVVRAQRLQFRKRLIRRVRKIRELGIDYTFDFESEWEAFKRAQKSKNGSAS